MFKPPSRISPLIYFLSIDKKVFKKIPCLLRSRWSETMNITEFLIDGNIWQKKKKKKKTRKSSWGLNFLFCWITKSLLKCHLIFLLGNIAMKRKNGTNKTRYPRFSVFFLVSASKFGKHHASCEGYTSQKFSV